MSSLFADTHNVVAILEKSYAAEVKRSDDVTRLQALVDKKNIVISEDVIREILQLDDAEGVVFANMRRVGKGFLGVETPLFEGMLVAREIAEEEITEEQVQADDAVAAAVRETVAEDVANEAITSTPTSLILPSPPSHDIPYTNQANKVKSSKLRYLKKVGTSQRVVSSDDIEDVFNQGRMIDDLDKDEGIELAEIYHLDLDHPSKVLSMQEDDSEVQKVVEVVTTSKLITKVVTIATSQVSATSATISAAKPSIPAAAPTGVAAYTRRRKGVIIRDPEEELSSKSTTETSKLKDKGKGILIKTPKPMKKKDQIELDAEYARKLHEEINKDVDSAFSRSYPNEAKARKIELKLGLGNVVGSSRESGNRGKKGVWKLAGDTVQCTVFQTVGVREE
nr:hypothetical protein [Tanacetum cinerariifolium]